MSESDFDAGRRVGEIKAMKDTQSNHDLRILKVEGRVSILERVAYTLIGAVALVQFAPSLKGFLG